jgi:hypothetical protein
MAATGMRSTSGTQFFETASQVTVAGQCENADQQYRKKAIRLTRRSDALAHGCHPRN